MSARKTKSASSKSSEKSPAVDAAGPIAPGEQFVGQWNRLISTTNWEKGQIICQWREELEAVEADAAQYTDEAWAALVGGVTSQHVGRLRRTYQRFGETFDQYSGLFWSHFHAALDWDDAEMWLEGAIQNDWSISQMRGKRWETLGKPGKPPTADDAAAASGEVEAEEPSVATVEVSNTSESKPVKAVGATASSAVDDDVDDNEAESASGDHDDDEVEAPAKRASKPTKQTTVAVDDLPEDLADAFEQFKLAIIGHRRGGWRETSPEAVIECLDSLRELTLAAE